MSFNIQYTGYSSDNYPATDELTAKCFEIHKAHLVHPVKITENRHGYVVTFEESGLDDKTMCTTISGNILTVQAAIKDNTGSMKRIFPGSLFVKNFNIPDNVNIQRLKASYREGVIRLTLPKNVTSTFGKADR